MVPVEESAGLGRQRRRNPSQKSSNMHDRNKVPVHCASLTDLCQLKHAELAKRSQKFSERAVLGGTKLRTTLFFEPSSLTKTLQLPRWLQQSSWMRQPDYLEWLEKLTTPRAARSGTPAGLDRTAKSSPSRLGQTCWSSSSS